MSLTESPILNALLVAALATAVAANFDTLSSPFVGNKVAESLLYILVPFAVHLLLTPHQLRKKLRQSKSLVTGGDDRGYIVREIEAKMKVAEIDVGKEPEDNNHMLQRAIAQYIADTVDLQVVGTDVMYQLLDKPVDELSSDDAPAKEKERMPSFEKRMRRRLGENVDDENTHDKIVGLQVGAAPARERWVEIDSGIFFQHSVHGIGSAMDEEPSQEKGARVVTTVYRLRSKRPDASQAIDALVERAFVNYQKLQVLQAARDSSRYLFVQTVQETKAPPASNPSEDSEPAKKKIVYKRYALGESKSFRTLFFDDKQRVLNLLDNFSHRRGKFGVKGFPYKLGLLLHGPPGTGKTSIIKAVAQHTKRHIVSVNLAAIKTNQDLMNAMFDLRYPIEGRDTPFVMNYEDVVFVLEDIDCAGASVVEARKDESDKPQSIATKWGLASTAIKAEDKLNLSGLLNVLDGVIDCPGRIVIMTSNHPEKLDPALVRPGRVNAQLYLGHMPAHQVGLMFEHYFSTSLSPEQRQQLQDLSNAASWTPAEVEEICAEHLTVEAAIDALRAEP